MINGNFYAKEICMLYIISKPLTGKYENLLSEIEKKLKERKIKYVIRVTTYGGEEKKFAELYSREKGNTIVAVGGDGMLNGVMNGLNPANAVLGLIPAGTGNDFAESAKIPHGLPALDIILDSQPKQTDYIQFSDGLRSINIAGLGIDVDILERCGRMKHFKAKSKYFISLVKSLFTYKGLRVTIKADGEEISGKILIAALCNGKQFGGDIPFCPSAEIDDHTLELIYLDLLSRLQIPKALFKLMKGEVLSLPYAHHIRCEEAEFVFENKLTAQYDGELYEAETFKAKVMTDLKMFRG